MPPNPQKRVDDAELLLFLGFNGVCKVYGRLGMDISRKPPYLQVWIADGELQRCGSSHLYTPGLITSADLCASRCLVKWVGLRCFVRWALKLVKGVDWVGVLFGGLFAHLCLCLIVIVMGVLVGFIVVITMFYSGYCYRWFHCSYVVVVFVVFIVDIVLIVAIVLVVFIV